MRTFTERHSEQSPVEKLFKFQEIRIRRLKKKELKLTQSAAMEASPENYPTTSKSFPIFARFGRRLADLKVQTQVSLDIILCNVGLTRRHW